MNNMTDGKKDGLALVYVKDSVAYPVALSKEQLEMLDITIGMCLSDGMKVIGDKPIGKVIKLLKK
ncbi:hypothetical protein FCV24_14030 [Clostridium botulinum]|jgi:hypothetical protein|uniref:hypothetical protein n=1 Tax=Clostridium botulinum TaxID=1491 RepID=UPI0005F8EF2F|nr:hypothetical protein [Clostridium botulinum]MBY6799500.1 hypothetical protein [Clostridium botulinum]MDU4545290.1 hypothetical protein [Clostridium botulinum]NFF20856.1 hypothetical protein [Clostridium botulinum]NFM75534.1 hypothetical protein [Clostridium botulinum]NFP81085.1 hypothetical protein [Clostridium botulinum]